MILDPLYQYTLGSKQPLWINNGSNLTVVGVIPAALAWVKVRNCRQKGCWRIGFHKVGSTHYKTCRKHATPVIHDRLDTEHAVKHPDLHAVLDRKK